MALGQFHPFIVDVCIRRPCQRAIMSSRYLSFSAFQLINRLCEFAKSSSLSVDDVATIPKLISTFDFPAVWPFEPEDFRKHDEEPDTTFYSQPRYVHHIDEDAQARLTQFYSANLRDGTDVLDLCSSWVSHYPRENWQSNTVVGLGLNESELQRNDQLTSYNVRDLNAEPALPYDDSSFDCITCVVSIDYLMQPRTLMAELHRVLKPGGKVFVAQSNRCFPTKVSELWRHTNDVEHAIIIATFFRTYADAESGFTVCGHNLPPRQAYADPLFIIEATKKDS
eukprot:TRINITY_DN10315_c0_g1_i1.p2 TRINITY_DN10315_c0_g1~~TRINITY_DN10315_c0_g1_i1.p2  ORF type:complete len:281 (+),score=16.35 TRINITY_DN10315_c0_g1_i1:3028-3870(+)